MVVINEKKNNVNPYKLTLVKDRYNYLRVIFASDGRASLKLHFEEKAKHLATNYEKKCLTLILRTSAKN